VFEEKTLLYCTPFYFKDGAGAKPKYFLVLKNMGNNLIIANLPSSQNYVPFPDKNVKHGCIDLPELTFKCFCIIKGKPVTDMGYQFPLTTFLYGRWVEDYSVEVIANTYRVEDEDYKNCGKISEELYLEILNCLKDSSNIQRRFKRMINEWLG
jgi:hypothetical protein